jgi:hypothetical protein
VVKKKAKPKAADAEAEARKILIEEDCLSGDTSTITQHTLICTLTLIIQKYSAAAPKGFMTALQAFTVLMQESNNAVAQQMPIMEALTQKIGDCLEKTVQKEMEKLSTTIKSSIADQCKSLSPTNSITDAVSTLRQVASDMGKSINEVTTATTQISDMVQSYKEALLSTTKQLTQPRPTNTQHASPSPGSGLQHGIDKKARQVLLDNDKGEDNHLNIYEIKESAAATLANLMPPPPEGSAVQEVIKLRNGSCILQFTTKETADWLQTPANEVAFTRRFDLDTSIRDHVHPIMVPRIPLSFDPSNPTHLREVEETNRLPTKAIKKARWIKPDYRHAPGQSCAHAIFTINSTADANRLLKDGIYVCNARIFPKKLKYKPKQCMKCRKWGHYAADCQAPTDTCRTCGGQHKTKDCTVANRRHCVSCRSDTHTSWDRNCPEFLRKCDEYSGFHPENNLLYFPTDEDWTLTMRPDKLPLEDKFPTHFTVSSLPPPDRTQRQLPSRPIGKKSKRPSNNDTSQAVLENFFERLVSTQEAQTDAPPARIDDDEDEYDTHFEGKVRDLPENFLQTHKP